MTLATHVPILTVMAHIGFGHGGWVRVDEGGFPGPVYVRYVNERGRAVPVEFYVDGRGHELRSDMFRDVDLGGFTAWAMAGDDVWLPHSTSQPGPDLSRLASHFATGFGSQARHWVADSMRAQRQGSGVPQAPMGPEPDLEADEGDERPAPVVTSENGLTDDFLKSVAANYLWAVRNRRRPAPFIASQVSFSVRTVHSWISKARARGFLAPTTKGRVG